MGAPLFTCNRGYSFVRTLVGAGRSADVEHMKKIEAVIQPHKLEEVRKALSRIGVDGIIISEVSGQGKEKGQVLVFRGVAYRPRGDLISKVKVEIFIPDYQVQQIIGVVSEAAWSGKIGDGKIFVSSIEEAIRIRNGDKGEDAL